MDRNIQALSSELATACRLIGALTLGAATLGGCKADPGTDTDTATETGGDGDPGDGDGDPGALAPTFWQDVAPIYYERCVTCHRAGGAAPFALDDYDAAREWAELSAAAVESRVMPPWLIADDGSCNTWRDSRARSEEQIARVGSPLPRASSRRRHRLGTGGCGIM